MPFILVTNDAAGGFDKNVILPLYKAFANAPFDAGRIASRAGTGEAKRILQGADLGQRVGFLFECYAKDTINAVAGEIGLAQCFYSGEFANDGIAYAAGPFGNITFEEGGDGLTEIDALYHYYGCSIQVPVVAEMKVGEHHGNILLKMSLAGRFFKGANPYYLKIRPAIDGEVPGPYVMPEIPMHRKLLVPIRVADIEDAASLLRIRRVKPPVVSL